MRRGSLASIVLTATVTACITAPLAMLLLTLFGLDGTLRTALVGSITAAVTATAAGRAQRATEAPEA